VRKQEKNKEGKREGQGTCKFANGESYEGEWKNGKMEGRGCFKMADGDVYDGLWKGGLKDGRGTYYYASGNADVVKFERGEETEEGVRFTTDRTMAWKLVRGDLTGEISLEEAREIVDRIGEPMPPQLKDAQHGASPNLRVTGGEPLKDSMALPEAEVSADLSAAASLEEGLAAVAVA